MRRVFWIILLFAWLVIPAQTQEASVIRFYIVPVEQVGNYRGPEYLAWRFDQNPVAELAGIRWSCKDYGIINQMVCAADVTVTQHDYLAAQSDVWVWAENLDTSLTSQTRSALSAFLENIAVPANWLSPQDTNRTALKTVTGIFLSMQRITALTGQNPLTSGLTLNTQFRNLDATWQAAITQAMTEIGLPAPGANDTIRAMLKSMADVWGTRSIAFGFVTL